MGKLRRVWRRLGAWIHDFGSGRSLACVGLVVLGGVLAVVIAPDPEEEGGRTFPLSTLPAVIIDAGHGGKDDGAKSRGVMEKKLTLEVALRLEKELNARGFPTVQTRTADFYVPLSERAAIANRVRGPALFVSIHFNQGSARNQAGIETFFADSKAATFDDWTWLGFFNRTDPPELGEDLAASVQWAVIRQTGARDRGARARHLYVTRHTRIPAILVEGGFISNRMESDLLAKGDYADRLASGIADGIEAWWQARHPQPALAQQQSR